MLPAPFHSELCGHAKGGKAFWLRSEDNVKLRLTLWPGLDASRGTVFLFPGRGEYAEKYTGIAGWLNAGNYAALCLDWRGQGLSDRLLDDPEKGYIDSYADYQTDLDTMLAAAAEMRLPKPWFILGHSMGACIALRRLTRDHPFIACAFGAPMWQIGVPRWLRPFAPAGARLVRGTKFAQGYMPNQGPQPYVLTHPFIGNELTSSAADWADMMMARVRCPQLTIAGATIQWVAAGEIETKALQKLPSPDLPCYVGLGGNERIIHTGAVHARMARWPNGTLEVIPGGEHELMAERTPIRARFLAGVAALFDAAA
ncbi:alpha/beta hydrolase [Thioclava sp. A2]|uniref:alpha/beta hydrolase n=1 Tax=Thioclava sp. FCG-A2 TaxID=3080562 RepID=UPI002953CEE9|nr:alpha/beta hydrolase [Thioclava sp. A2]MDV7270168.1 alpha/beta hydrolase [Thioclava sp. A2]